MTDLRFSQVPPEHLDFVWAQVAPMVERGLRHGAGDCTTPAHLKEAIRRGAMMLWAVHEGETVTAVIVVSVYQYPAKKTVFVEMAAGRDMDSWIDGIMKLLADYRDLIGADTVEASCRHGLARYLERRGWKRKAVLMEAP